MPDIVEEQTILDRLAKAHGEWHSQRLPPPPPEDSAAMLARIQAKIQNPEPPDVEVLRLVPDDPLRAAIWSQLSVVGWRLYAKGGVTLLTTVYHRLERDQHPSFIWALSTAWSGIGWPDDPRGVWNARTLL